MISQILCPFISLLMAIVMSVAFIACGSEPQAATGTSAAQPTAEPSASVATAVAQAETNGYGRPISESGMPYCGRLCQPSFWLNAHVTALAAEIARGAQH